MRESAEQRPRLIQTVQRLEGVGLWGGWWGEGGKRGAGTRRWVGRMKGWIICWFSWPWKAGDLFWKRFMLLTSNGREEDGDKREEEVGAGHRCCDLG